MGEARPEPGDREGEDPVGAVRGRSVTGELELRQAGGLVAASLPKDTED